ncbi:hypothetical protein VBD025_15160 [Virgibacillus flavescens]|uniref:hypothetical protein n=1 Tax=Virgibacillus flavescens TaxID=1611422 RepID=UPI003D33BC63
MKKVLFIILITLILGACSQTETNTISSATENMPESMPEDFNFSVQFGMGKKNEINTFEGIVTKDLITDGTATAEITLTEKEMSKVYEEMREVNIVELNNFTPESVNGTICIQDPHGEDEWKITFNNETITHFLSLKYCEPTNDARKLIQLRNYVLKIIKNKDEYQALPDSKGRYQ